MSGDWQNFELPSNRKFGALFTLVFLALAVHLYRRSSVPLAEAATLSAAIFAGLAVFKPVWLGAANRLWFRAGQVMGHLVNPIVVGLLFIGIFVPVGIAMRLFGRDALAVKHRSANTYWRERSSSASDPDGFKNQF
jgi:hypothetical protein